MATGYMLTVPREEHVGTTPHISLAAVSRPSHETTNLATPTASDSGYPSPGDLGHDSDIVLPGRDLVDSISSLPPPDLPPVPETPLPTQVLPLGADSDDDCSVIRDRLEATAEFSENEEGLQRRGSPVDAIPEEAGSESLTTEDGMDVTPWPDRILTTRAFSRSDRPHYRESEPGNRGIVGRHRCRRHAAHFPLGSYGQISIYTSLEIVRGIIVGRWIVRVLCASATVRRFVE